MNWIVRKKGFSLIEVITALLVVAAITGIALPRFTLQLERTKSAEAVHILESIYNAQRAYFYEYQAYASALSALDVTVPAPEGFNAPTAASSDPIASIASKSGNYTLRIDSAGALSCVGTGTICTQLGY
ncbi:MAG TPA: type II secretion system protein [Candidatus Omnitrophota bacterium]|nr:type II secretion system protein [Candidatus Omnitrophota bacterium]